MNRTPSIITRFSPAKINLFLHITGKRSDGYHDLQTVFRLLDFGDTLRFTVGDAVATEPLAEDSDTLCRALITIDGAEAITKDIGDNLIFKAAHALLRTAIIDEHLPDALAAIKIAIDKRLPMGAGLGGGSSNAATTLQTLNTVWDLNYETEMLLGIGRSLGADVPIFIFGQDAIATGIGEVLTPIDLPAQRYLLLTPDAHASTAALFAHPKLRRDIAPIDTHTVMNETAQFTETLSPHYHNVFTPVVTELAPAVQAALDYLHSLEATVGGHARMTGSGSAVFLPIAAHIADDKTLLARWVKDAPCQGYVVGSL
ncbi:4-(cytidine 5'-diphospho)-2-C-methyl-D-erythritol kinase [Psychrobacter aestuarii]|uniref:4-diphosphocytidyl-2-C-methyl-D-erythritol kinase n=1 Tax=Psychrobacter aestuarii TaxID=556327 RepID=A0ABP3FB46_9GAMM|nr:4-(cytidine 5'-diphospho)-2-C-methyl-D-erythritol kinase [Psychrobacter aestuarii]